MTRKELRTRVKLMLGLSPDREDGNLSDEHFNTAINMAIRQVAYDCNLLPELRKFALEVNKWRYPMDNDVDLIRSCWYISSSGVRIELQYCSPEEFYNIVASSTAEVPFCYTYPMMQSEVYEFWAGAPPVYDYVLSSNVTDTSTRTIIDSGINFGYTRQCRYVKPGDIVHNLTDDSYGYVETLDTTKVRVTGTIRLGTNTNTLYDNSKDFVALGVTVGDIICTPATGVVTGYARVTEVANDHLVYSNYYSTNGTVAFIVEETYKVGIANEIRLKGTPPHPGLRSGARNYFYVSEPKGTVTGDTVFSPHGVTGTVSSAIEIGDTAIADSGSHGIILSVSDHHIGVNYWIGGVPNDGESVVIKRCDRYQVETLERTQRAIWLGPTPSRSDTIGTESLEILYTSVPTLPTADYELLEIPDKYEQPLQRCAEWQVAILTGTFSRNELDGFERAYRVSVLPYRHDIYRPPSGQQLTVWNNRYGMRSSRRHGLRNYTWKPKTS